MRQIDFDDDASADDSIDHLLRGLRTVLVKHPIAAQAAFAALTREGRKFAESEEGARLRDVLARSPQIARLRDVWSVGSMNVLSERSDGPMPTAFIEAIAAAAARLDETALARIFEVADDFF